MSKLADYLAKNYLTADPAPESKRKSSSGKKRKRKGTLNDANAAGDVATATSGLIIADDDVLDWGDANGKKATREEDGFLDGMEALSRF